MFSKIRFFKSIRVKIIFLALVFPIIISFAIFVISDNNLENISKYSFESFDIMAENVATRFIQVLEEKELEDFKKRINIKMRGEDKKDKGDGSSGSARWYLGSDNRDTGSIHSDFYEDSAVNFCHANNIAVYPVIGWWRERSYLGRYDSKVRYSLIISLSTPKQDIDLYTPIVTQISNEIQIDIPTN